ncbi:hypothetical protein HPB48_007908 [Haemaphysalis longicornis]|uniref:HTH psq-type domain-containing protein n=1 Tax=Haemaphysalis longicornis TaxID=44386 RepID=A0A9J6GM19_HAELO|nr:hypothetical protein HPB48_007908 [Haemaphysalis longicornis]
MAEGKPAVPAAGAKWKALEMSTKRAILSELSQGVKNCQLVNTHGVSKSTILMIPKNKDKLVSADANSTDREHLWKPTNADVEDALLMGFAD